MKRYILSVFFILVILGGVFSYLPAKVAHAANPPGCYLVLTKTTCPTGVEDSDGITLAPASQCYKALDANNPLSSSVWTHVSCDDLTTHFISPAGCPGGPDGPPQPGTDCSKNAATSANNTDSSSSDQSNTPTCESSGGPLSWIFCKLIDGLSDTVSWMNDSIIQPMLQTPPISVSPATDSKTHTYAIWSNFRIYGNIILVIALLALVFGEVIGGGIIDAYTAKKMLPRILIGAILINLSIYIVAGLVDITNILGKGIGELIGAPFGIANANVIHISGLSSLVGSSAVAGTIWAGTILSGAAVQFFLVFILLPVALAFIGILVTILIRQGLIIFLVLSAPIAFALYCLPNTEQYFKKWWKLLFTTLLVYPLVEALFALANALSVTINNLGGPSATITQLMSIIGLMVPLFLIPFAFKISGGAIGSLNGAISGIGKKATEAIKGNVNDPNSLRNKTKRRMGENATRYQSGLIGNRNYTGPRRLVSKGADLFGNADARLAGYNKAAAERRDAITNFGNDDLVFAGAGYALRNGETNWDGNINSTGKNQYFNSKGRQITSDMYNKGKSLYGGSQHDITQGAGYTIYKAQTDDDVKAMQFSFNKNAEAGNWTDGQIEGNWLGATYPYKGTFGSVRYSVPKRDPATNKVVSPDIASDDKAYYSLLKDFHKTRPSFRLSEVRDQDWNKLHQRQIQLENRVATGAASADDARNLAMTYEMFGAASHELRTGPATTPGTSTGGGAATPEVSASGVSAASQSIIENAVNSRKMDVEIANSNTMEKKFVKKGDGTSGVPIIGGIYTTGDSIK